ncbi:unnamed protein product [Prunus armeniaca]|uniref:Uncharacterized protein n=1 Tax=Prunus armeniaca TaxID=36596 RepID=A0A6J5TUA9_PRUAR|nr:unnamed protein product [Prunus armeniaca]
MAKSKTREAGGASSSSKSREKPLMIPNSINFFSELEVNAIELLVQLGGSSCYNGRSTEEESDGKSRAPPPPGHGLRRRPSNTKHYLKMETKRKMY